MMPNGRPWFSKYLRVRYIDQANATWLLITVCGLFAVGASMAPDVLLAQQEDDPITDLPFHSGSYRVTCPWHTNCLTMSSGNGIDLGMPFGTLVTAGGHGTVEQVGENRDWGRRVVLDHDGGHTSSYNHLEFYFPAQESNVCRYTAVGYSGNSGANVVGAHLHFHGDHPPGTDPFTPIFGLRDGQGGGTRYTYADFENVATPTATPFARTGEVEHSCGPNGGFDCRRQTGSLTVDEVQSTSSPPLCLHCEWDEFDLHGTRWEPGSPGFDYTSLSQGAHHRVPLKTPEDSVQSAVWRPQLMKTDTEWTIWAFIPSEPPDADVSFAKAVKYWINWCQIYNGDNHTCIDWGSAETIVNQRQLSESAETRNGWFKLQWIETGSGASQEPFSTVPTFWTADTGDGPAIQVGVRNYRVGACVYSAGPDPCAREFVMADAVMFVPSECE